MIHDIGHLVHNNSQTHIPPPTRRPPRRAPADVVHGDAQGPRDVRVPRRDGLHVRRGVVCAGEDSGAGPRGGVYVFVLG